jgi:hypothetical protein
MKDEETREGMDWVEESMSTIKERRWFSAALAFTLGALTISALQTMMSIGSGTSIWMLGAAVFVVGLTVLSAYYFLTYMRRPPSHVKCCIDLAYAAGRCAGADEMDQLHRNRAPHVAGEDYVKEKIEAITRGDYDHATDLSSVVEEVRGSVRQWDCGLIHMHDLDKRSNNFWEALHQSVHMTIQMMHRTLKTVATETLEAQQATIEGFHDTLKALPEGEYVLWTSPQMVDDLDLTPEGLAEYGIHLMVDDTACGFAEDRKFLWQDSILLFPQGSVKIIVPETGYLNEVSVSLVELGELGKPMCKIYNKGTFDWDISTAATLYSFSDGTDEPLSEECMQKIDTAFEAAFDKMEADGE